MGDRLGAEGEEATRLERELRDTQARLQLLQTYVGKHTITRPSGLTCGVLAIDLCVWITRDPCRWLKSMMCPVVVSYLYE